MASFERVMQLFEGETEDRMASESYDWTLPRAFQLNRHLEKIEGIVSSPQCWRMKERVNVYFQSYKTYCCVWACDA